MKIAAQQSMQFNCWHMNGIIDALAGRRRLLWIFLLLMTGPAIWGVRRLEFSDQPQLLLNEDDAQVRQLQELYKIFDLDAPTAVLVVQADEIFSRKALVALRNLVDEVEQMEDVQRVESLLDVPVFEPPEILADWPLLGRIASLIPRPLVPPGDTDAETMAEARQKALEHPLVAGWLLSSDGRTTLVVARLDVHEAGEAARAVVGELKNVAERYSDETPLGVRVTGVAPIRVEIFENLRTEMPRFLLLAVVTFVPLVCSTRIGLSIRPRRKPAAPAKWMQQFLEMLGEWVVRWRRSVAIIGFVLAVSLGSTALKLTPSNRLTDALPADTEAQRALQHIDRSVGGILQAQVVVEWSEGRNPFSPQVLSAMREIHQSVSDGGAQAWSLVSVVEALPDEYEPLVRYIDPADLDAMEPIFQQRMERLLQPERRQALVHIRLPDWGTAANSEFFSDLRGRLREAERQHAGLSLDLTGRTVLASERVGQVMRELGKSIGFATVLIALAMSLGFRSLRLGLVSMLPNLLTLAVVSAVIFVVGGVVTLTALMVFSVCLGIATDDTIHFLNGFRSETRESGRAAAVIATVRRVGPALTTSTLVLLAGFGAASLSTVPTTQEFARLASTAVATALAADVILLPALLVWLGPTR